MAWVIVEHLVESMPTYQAMYTGTQAGNAAAEDGSESLATPPRRGGASEPPSSGDRPSVMSSGRGKGRGGEGPERYQ